MDQKNLDTAAAIATTALIGTVAALTLLPGNRLPLRQPRNDKLAHAVAWAALTFPLSAARPSSIKYTLPAAVAFGAAVEAIQPSVGRSREAGDIVADFLGASAGCIAGYILHRALKANRRR